MQSVRKITAAASSAQLCRVEGLRRDRLPQVNLNTTWWEDREQERDNPNYYVSLYERTGQQGSQITGKRTRTSGPSQLLGQRSKPVVRTQKQQQLYEEDEETLQQEQLMKENELRLRE